MKKLLLTGLILLPAAAFAHVGDHSLLNWRAGILHPFTGLDHLLALVATGCWLAQHDNRHKFALATGFIVLLPIAMWAGAVFNHLDFEAGVVSTLIVLGLLMLFAIRGPWMLQAGVVATTAAIHGFVHGTELSGGVPGMLAFASALVLGSAALITGAMVLGSFSGKFANGWVTRIGGAILLLLGISMTT